MTEDSYSQVTKEDWDRNKEQDDVTYATGQVTGCVTEKPEFNLRPVHAGFVIDKVAMGHVSLQVL